MQDALNQIGRYCQRYHNTIKSTLVASHTCPTARLCETTPPAGVVSHGGFHTTAAYRNHMLFWSGFNHFSPCLSKIVLHSTSGTICATPELYGSLNLALSCSGGMTPHAVKSRKSVAAFKVMAGTLVGGRSVLRSPSRMRAFCYKWTFLSAAAFEEKVPSRSDRAFKNSNSVGTSFFTFECGLYDYKAFEPLPGLYVQFDLS